MTTHIPHSLDAVIVAVQALIDGRPIPESWQTDDSAPIQPPAQVVDEALIMQALSEIIDQKIAAIPAPQLPPDPELAARVERLERANAALPPGFEENVLLALDIQKSGALKNDDLESRVAALETIMLRLGAAVHKEQAA